MSRQVAATLQITEPVIMKAVADARDRLEYTAGLVLRQHISRHDRTLIPLGLNPSR